MNLFEKRFWKILTIAGGLFIAAGGGAWLRPIIISPFQHEGFESLKTPYNLHDTTWTGYFMEVDERGVPQRNEGVITFEQKGSRIIGKGYSSGYGWLVEGVIYKGSLVYVYVGSDPNAKSIGATTLQIDESGTILSGQWSGWTPQGEKLKPQAIKLKKQK